MFDDPQTLINQLLAAGVTQAEIAEAMNVSQPYVSRLLHGTRSGDDMGWRKYQALHDLHARKVRRVGARARAARIDSTTRTAR